MRSTLTISICIAALAFGAQVGAQETAETPPANPDTVEPPPTCDDADSFKKCKAACEEKFEIEQEEEELVPPKDPSLKTHGWISLGVGGGLLVTGAVTGIVALKLNNRLEGDCDDGGSCPPDYHGDLDSRDNFAMTSTITLVTGITFSTLGILLLTAFSQDEDPATAHLSVTPSVGPHHGGAAVNWRF